MLHQRSYIQSVPAGISPSCRLHNNRIYEMTSSQKGKGSYLEFWNKIMINKLSLSFFPLNIFKRIHKKRNKQTNRIFVNANAIIEFEEWSIASIIWVGRSRRGEKTLLWITEYITKSFVIHYEGFELCHCFRLYHIEFMSMSVQGQHGQKVLYPRYSHGCLQETTTCFISMIN